MYCTLVSEVLTAIEGGLNSTDGSDIFRRNDKCLEEYTASQHRTPRPTNFIHTFCGLQQKLILAMQTT